VAKLLSVPFVAPETLMLFARIGVVRLMELNDADWVLAASCGTDRLRARMTG
jgi:hypothetical protein